MSVTKPVPSIPTSWYDEAECRKAFVEQYGGTAAYMSPMGGAWSKCWALHHPNREAFMTRCELAYLQWHEARYGKGEDSDEALYGQKWVTWKACWRITTGEDQEKSELEYGVERNS